MTALFITSTGTEIGKTFVARGMIRHLHDRGRTVDAIKPVVSGFMPRTLATSDPGLLLFALGRSVSIKDIADISPWRFVAPLSPDLAARREERQIDLNALVDFCRTRAAQDTDVLLIEGVGGVMVPLNDQHTVVDWMSALGLPVILVAGNYLGTISHTLTALEVLARRRLAVMSIVISDTEGATTSLEDNAETIARFAPGIEVLTLPRLPKNSFRHPTFVQLTERL
jgi:dethiobiotin synthetase